jgi:oxalate decarboxylase/phosphoglucose isomerase-like protein (cupin superfamily)
MTPRLVMCGAVLCFCVTAVAFAQDPVKVDPAHYKVEMENAKVRVLRIHYGAHEKSVMHSHPAAVAIFLTDGTARMTDAKGKTQDMPVKAGQVMYTPAQVHLPENTGDAPFDLIVVELKSGGMAKAAPKAEPAK